MMYPRMYLRTESADRLSDFFRYSFSKRFKAIKQTPWPFHLPPPKHNVTLINRASENALSRYEVCLPITKREKTFLSHD